MDRKLTIEQTIGNMPFVRSIYDVVYCDLHFKCKVDILLDDTGDFLTFSVVIYSTYPFKIHNSETINFYNKDLISYAHVMESGNICIHTSHSTSLEEKLNIDFMSLKRWINKYYLSKDVDVKYEHIITEPSSIDEKYYAFLFTECESNFHKGEFGIVEMSRLKNGIYKNEVIFNFIIQKFASNQVEKECSFNAFYKAKDISLYGLYFFMGDSPAHFSKFSFNNYSELNSYLSLEFLELLYKHEAKLKATDRGLIVPLFLGYNINDEEIHWQVALLKVGEFPIMGVPEIINGNKTGRWETCLLNKKIEWGLSRNVSYNYYFGRGAFSSKLVAKKILIIGIGAIGSMVAKTLTRCGCLYIDVMDYDVKEPENVCRSEFTFDNGISNKTFELLRILSEISPFISCSSWDANNVDVALKSLYLNRGEDEIKKVLEKYDIVFDCSTDNDLMYILDSLRLKCDVVNISITNHARELVCAFNPNLYRFVITQFEELLDNEIDDFYEPTGCWNPTFKASYNDICCLVQLALKHINKLYDQDKYKFNFIIKGDDRGLKLIEF